MPGPQNIKQGSLQENAGSQHWSNVFPIRLKNLWCCLLFQQSRYLASNRQFSRLPHCECLVISGVQNRISNNGKLCLALGRSRQLIMAKQVQAIGSHWWRAQENFMGGFIHWHMVVISIWCVLFVKSQLMSQSCSQTNVSAKFVDTISIFFYIHSSYFMCHCTEYKLSTLDS